MSTDRNPDETVAASAQPAADGQPRADESADRPPTADQVKLALRKVKDPELNLNIIDLGLVYDIVVEDAEVEIDMTLTSPGCPAGPQIMGEVERVVKGIPGVGDVRLNLVWSPFWTPELIEPRVRAYMGL